MQSPFCPHPVLEQPQKSPSSIGLNLLIVNQILIYDKFKHSDTGFEYFIATNMIISLYLYVLFASNEWTH